MRVSALPSHLAALILSSQAVAAFYLPGVTPESYKAGDAVTLNVNHVTPGPRSYGRPLRSAFSFDYYHHAFHFCKPEGGAEYKSESLGSILFGDRILSSPFELRMNKNETCKAVCDEVTFEPRDAKFVNRRIKQGYNVNWLVDGLPAGSELYSTISSEKEGDPEVEYQPGFPLGAAPTDEQVYLYNHYDIIIDYHEIRPDLYRVVGILVEPSSMPNSKRTGTGDDVSAQCSYDDPPLQLSEEQNTTVTWTYSVGWRPSRTTFATRWDKYLHVYDPKIHWLSIINSAFIVLFLTGIVSTIMHRTLRKDIARYNRLDQLGLEDLNGTSVEDGIQDESGWKLVHGDVFRPPKNALMLSVFVGNGAQLFAMTGFTIAFATVGFLSPSNRGSVATAMVLMYAFFGFVGGYTSSRVYKSFGGTKWKQLFVFTPAVVPIVVFGTFFLLNLFVWARGSSGAVPFTTMLVIIGIWFVITVPLSVAGSWMGFRRPTKDDPTRTNQIPRQIPPSTGYLRPIPSMLAVGILPFGAIFIELYFIMISLWSNQIYYMFGFLFLSFGLLIVTSAAVTIMVIYFLLCAENYHWQWRAFASSGASAIYVFLYSLFYWARMLSFSTLTGGLLYLGYSALITFLWFVMTGTIGFFASWVFVHRIYGSLKID